MTGELETSRAHSDGTCEGAFLVPEDFALHQLVGDSRGINSHKRTVGARAELVNRAGSSLTEIVGSVKRVAEIVSEIAAASREQSDGVQQVDETVTRMEAVTQKNASLVEESTASLGAVDRQVDGMLEVVSFFNVAHAGVRELQADLAKRMSARPAEPAAKPAPAEPRPAVPPRAAADRWKGF